ncbi:MAG: hypothetical protein ACREF5_02505 [Candidatus Saccharimonadales bacterium]
MATHQTMNSEKLAVNTSPQSARNDKAVKAILNVKVWSPFQTFFDGQASSLSGINATGPFDILPHHHNFITILSACDLSLQTADGKVRIKISGGVMHVQKDNVTVFLEV